MPSSRQNFINNDHAVALVKQAKFDFSAGTMEENWGEQMVLNELLVNEHVFEWVTKSNKYP